MRFRSPQPVVPHTYLTLTELLVWKNTRKCGLEAGWETFRYGSGPGGGDGNLVSFFLPYSFTDTENQLDRDTLSSTDSTGVHTPYGQRHTLDSSGHHSLRNRMVLGDSRDMYPTLIRGDCNRERARFRVFHWIVI